MKALRLACFLSWLGIFPALLAAEGIAGKVVGVHDGDTITVLVEKQELKVRLYGIDAPELHGQPYGQDAKKALSKLVFGKIVRVEIVSVDRYGRSIGRVSIGSLDVNLEMVRSGFAWWYQHYAKNDASLESAESEARKAKAGLWRGKNPVPPWQWRSKKQTD